MQNFRDQFHSRFGFHDLSFHLHGFSSASERLARHRLPNRVHFLRCDLPETFGDRPGGIRLRTSWNARLFVLPERRRPERVCRSARTPQKKADKSQFPQSLLRRETARSIMLSTVDTMDVAIPSQNASSDLKKTPKRLRSPDHVFTLGIEEELQIIDPDTRELRSHIQQILADGKMILKEQIKPELHQSIVEIGTEICSDPRDARRQITALRTELAKRAAQHGLVIASAGTHPFSHWMDQLITVNERYATIINDLQQVARVCLTFGLHVHVGIPDREEAIDIMNQARYFLPHLYALSVNSPFWLGHNTGLKAYRQMIFERLPRTGIPDAFQSLSEYEDYWKLLVA